MSWSLLLVRCAARSVVGRDRLPAVIQPSVMPSDQKRRLRDTRQMAFDREYVGQRVGPVGSGEMLVGHGSPGPQRQADGGRCALERVVDVDGQLGPDA